MLEMSGVWKQKRDDLKTKRDSLFKRYTKHTHEVRLSLEIKKIDDEIVECTKENTFEQAETRFFLNGRPRAAGIIEFIHLIALAN
jgi:hypothetical protein